MQKQSMRKEGNKHEQDYSLHISFLKNPSHMQFLKIHILFRLSGIAK